MSKLFLIYINVLKESFSYGNDNVSSGQMMVLCAFSSCALLLRSIGGVGLIILSNGS